MSKSVPTTAPPARQVAAMDANPELSRVAVSGRSWIGLLRTSSPVVVIGIAIIVLWYAVGIHSNMPFAREILGTSASSAQVFQASLNLSSPWVPLPHQVLGDFFNALAQPLDSPRGLWIHMGTTGMEALLGLVLGTILGLLIATVFVYSRPLENAFLPYAIASQTVPVIALAPIVISMLGITLAAKVVVSAYLAFFRHRQHSEGF